MYSYLIAAPPADYQFGIWKNGYLDMQIEWLTYYPYLLKHLFLGSSATGPPIINDNDQGAESAANHQRDQYSGRPVQAVRDGVEGSLRYCEKGDPGYLFGMLLCFFCS